MSHIQVVENKKSAVFKYLGILERYKEYTLEEIERDIDIRGALERYLYLAVQATIDLAEAIIAYKGLRKPATMAETFSITMTFSFVTTRSEVTKWSWRLLHQARL